MDLFTHFLVPFIILFFLGCKNPLAGGLGGISIDFDVVLVIIGFLFPYLFIFSHRGITHSLIFGFITAIIFLYIISRKPVRRLISKAIKRDFNIDFNWKTITLAYFGVLMHLLLDFLTTGGLPLFYPFSLAKFSGEIYYYTDLITTLVSLSVLIIIYLKINLKYKKIIMILFLIMLILFGGIRAYEKNNAINSMESSLNENFTEITAYPTSDTFIWKVVLFDPKNQKYELYDYYNLNGSKNLQGSYNKINITGNYSEGMKAIAEADETAVVESFKWDSFYTCVNAQEQASQWKITYFDFLATHYRSNNITVYVKK
ncbi:metal-dependent hydrolase [Methanobacterium alcaliphilum]|uniref:metal-dependent hydrolase n=1 Tax=Methanobacterium alcaliphilum TaxID=392018 RepID=UPI00200B95A6|nr:metal-dependent hydrolase [Methanobacterium alcaliphilum]MCK9151419.1 metal-dependent hydrolase [Methanobacterium alcaliphilum]